MMATVDRRAHLLDRDLYQRFYNVDQYPGRIMTALPDEPRLLWALAHIGPTNDVLDIGCHKGDVTLALRRQTTGKVNGIDISRSAIADAQTYVYDERIAITYDVGDAERLPYPDNSFDVAVLTEVLEHVIDPHQVIAEAERVVRPGGTIVISTPGDALGLDRAEAPQRDRKIGMALDMHVREYVPAMELKGKAGLRIKDEAVTRTVPNWSHTYIFHLASYPVVKP